MRRCSILVMVSYSACHYYLREVKSLVDSEGWDGPGVHMCVVEQLTKNGARPFANDSTIRLVHLSTAVRPVYRHGHYLCLVCC